MTIQMGFGGQVPRVLIKPAPPAVDLTVGDLLNLLQGIPPETSVRLEGGDGPLNRVVRRLDAPEPFVALRRINRSSP